MTLSLYDEVRATIVQVRAEARDEGEHIGLEPARCLVLDMLSHDQRREYEQEAAEAWERFQRNRTRRAVQVA